MTPAFYVIYGVILTLLAAGLIYFGMCAYYLSVALNDASGSLQALAQSMQGLPQNLHGVTPALSKLAGGVVEHEKQVYALVGVIADANKNAPVEKPPPFEENGKDANWQAHIPQSAFEEEER